MLGLIQYWADSFRGRPQLGTVAEVYEDLRAQGVEFPPMDLDQLAPVQTPTRPQQGPAPSAPEDQVIKSHDIHMTSIVSTLLQQLPLTIQAQPGAAAPPRGQRSHRGPIGPLKPEQVLM